MQKRQTLVVSLCVLVMHSNFLQNRIFFRERSLREKQTMARTTQNNGAINEGSTTKMTIMCILSQFKKKKTSTYKNQSKKVFDIGIFSLENSYDDILSISQVFCGIIAIGVCDTVLLLLMAVLLCLSQKFVFCASLCSLHQ